MFKEITKKIKNYKYLLIFLFIFSYIINLTLDSKFNKPVFKGRFKLAYAHTFINSKDIYFTSNDEIKNLLHSKYLFKDINQNGICELSTTSLTSREVIFDFKYAKYLEVYLQGSDKIKVEKCINQILNVILDIEKINFDEKINVKKGVIKFLKSKNTNSDLLLKEELALNRFEAGYKKPKILRLETYKTNRKFFSNNLIRTFLTFAIFLILFFMYLLIRYPKLLKIFK